MDEGKAPVPFLTMINNVLHPVFPNIAVFINNQQIYISNGLFVYKSYISNNFKGAISEYKGVLHCEGYEFGKIPYEIMEAPLFEPLFTRRL